ncbi:hypothetical protein Pmani_020522 [Petrolisthes manimaculis]|uniref:Helitron helicase-like domain-containing protein n=1 Tax=Petrolisthes manimaculis TaxID=1843537 RepID=A0AAE1PIJ1_9EUCA|nr:hypothetical protein Pmani_020522 [Petrolisthes manimaculis]
MKQRQQDALAFVSQYGSPDFFITFTFNPKWVEIGEAMVQTGSPSSTSGNNRPDLVSRIFKEKVNAHMDDLKKTKVFGTVRVHLYSIEWQKRGLPHVHILVWMERRVNAEIVDQLITAEKPDPVKEPILYEIVTRCMIHGPCKGFDDSQPCCQTRSSSSNGTCSKGFPKTCRDDTLLGNNGYPMYEWPPSPTARWRRRPFVHQ